MGGQDWQSMSALEGGLGFACHHQDVQSSRSLPLINQAGCLSPARAAMSTTTVDPATGRVTSCVCARVGLLGNPSDGYNGKTISFSLANFYAEVGRTVSGRGRRLFGGTACRRTRVHGCSQVRVSRGGLVSCGLSWTWNGTPPLRAPCWTTHRNCVACAQLCGSGVASSWSSWPQVVVDPADVVSFVPHPDHDRFQYASLQGLATQVEAQGYYGGVRLMMVSGGEGLVPSTGEAGAGVEFTTSALQAPFGRHTRPGGEQHAHAGLPAGSRAYPGFLGRRPCTALLRCRCMPRSPPLPLLSGRLQEVL